MNILKQLLYGLSFRFVLHIAFLVLPVLSYGQELHTSDNTLPLSGLENVYVEQQQNIEPLLFVASDAIISKSTTTTLFVNGSTQINTVLVAQSDISKYPTPLPEKTQIKVNSIAKEAATEVKQSDNDSVAPYLPCKKNPLEQEIFCATVASVCCPSTTLLKKKNNNSFGLPPHCVDLLPMGSKAKCYRVYCTDNITTAFEKNLTKFSSRPPPVSTPI